MKKLFTVLALLLVNSVLFAIVPPTFPLKMSYQAVVRNSSNVLVTNQQVGMKTSILQGSVAGTAVYVEIYNPNYITNANGLVTVEIGGGIPITGTFSTINWATVPYFIKTEVDPTGGTAYTITAISELLSMPYALHAKTAQTADYNSLSNLPIFATVATSGSYNDLGNKPSIINSQWTTSGNNIYYNLGQVGIGTSSPTKALTVITGGSDGILVKSTSSYSVIDIDAIGDAAVRFYKAGSGKWVLRNEPSTDDFEFIDYGVGTKMIIKNGTGNVGIGTSTPQRTLHLSSPSVSNELIMEVQNGLANWKKWNFFVDGGTGAAQNFNLRILNDAGTAPSRNVMSWLNNGNVGIGTSSPGSKLDVEGTVNIGGGNASELNRDQTTTANLVPIAYGCVSANGTIHAVGSTTNFTIIKTGTGLYEINISGISVAYYDFTVCATIIGPGPGFIGTGSANAHVTVGTYNTSGTATDRAFYFVVYKP